MNNRIYILFLMSTLALSSLAQLTWEARKSIPQYGRHAGISFEIDGKIYVGLGRLADGSYSDDFWEYNPTNDTWTQKADYPGGAKFLPTGFAINGKGYVCLGLSPSNTLSNVMYEYTPSTDSWTSKASFTGAARYSAASFVIGDTAYVGTGTCGGTSCYYSDLYMYVPATNSWTQRANFPGGNSINVVGFTIGQQGYFGNRTTTANQPNNSFYAYNPTSNTWSTIASMPGSARRLTSAFVINNEAYVGCGTISGSPITNALNNFYKYSPTTNSWSQISCNSNYTEKIDPEIVATDDSSVFSFFGNTSLYSLSEVWKLKLDFDTCDYYDTAFIDVFDTTFIDIFDTTFTDVFDTTFIDVYDTTFTDVFDTTFIDVFDTTYLTISDTTFIFDTTFVVKRDTIVDTIYLFVTDTTYFISYDTIYTTINTTVEDTLNIYATGWGQGCGELLWQLYPNPSATYLNFYSNKPSCFTGSKIEIIDQLGQILQTHPFDQNPIQMDIRGYARALYYIRLVDPNGTLVFSKKFIIN